MEPMNRKPEIGEYIQVRFNFPRESQFDYIGYVTRYRFSDDTVTVHIVQGDPAKVGKAKNIDWKSEGVVELSSNPIEEDIHRILDLALFLKNRPLFEEAFKDLEQFKEKAAE